MSGSAKLSPASIAGPLVIGGSARVARETPFEEGEISQEGALGWLGLQYDPRIGMVACFNEDSTIGGKRGCSVDVIWPEGEDEEVPRDLVTSSDPDQEELLTPLERADLHREAGNLLFRAGRHMAAGCEYVESITALDAPLEAHGREGGAACSSYPGGKADDRCRGGGGEHAQLSVGCQVHVVQKDGRYRPGMIACIEGSGRETTVDVMYDDDEDPDEESDISVDRIQRANLASVRLTVEDELKRTGLTNLGRCFMSLGKWKSAVCAASAALSLDPNHAKALFLRAQARIKLGKFEDARADLQVLKTMLPTNLEVRMAMREWREAKRAKAEADRAFFAEVLGLARRAQRVQVTPS